VAVLAPNVNFDLFNVDVTP